MPEPEPPQSSIILYQTEDGRTRIQCRFELETLWLTQVQIAELFQTSVPNISLHLKAIYAEGELWEAATVKSYLIVRTEGARQVSREVLHYSLPAILAVGYRVRSHRGTQFRQWATARLTEFLVKGFVIRIIEIREREAHRVAIFMNQIDQSQKTLVFCATQEHALAVRDLINQLKSSSDTGYCERVTADDGELGEQHLRAFQDNEKTIPTILTTSQKLSTGVDARNICNVVLMRPIHSIIEFKQIIGRGTRLYDGKDYFTIWDFVKAHHHFSDPEWDGEPLAPEEGDKPVRPPMEGFPPERVRDADDRDADDRQRPKRRIRVKLADGKARTIQHMMCTSFWHPDGTPMSAQQFMEMLFGKLPDFFKDEDELRAIWSAPDTRRRLLQGLAEKGFGGEQLAEMQKIIDAEKSDLFDVLAHVAYALPPITREERAWQARVEIGTRFNNKQKQFLDFVLSHYVDVGVRLRYRNSIADAIADLGRAEEIGRIFAGFQKYLYQPEATP